MATPITWQNINAPDLASASRPLEAAQRSFNGVFDQLGAMLAQRQMIGEQNWVNTKVNNTNAFLDRLASFKTPEELAAAQQSGVLNQLRSQFGAQIDSNAIRGAEEQRLNALRLGAKQAGEYQDWSTDRAQFSDVEKARQLIADKNFAGARAHLGNVDLRQESALWNLLTAGERQNVVQEREDWRYGEEKKLAPLVIDAKQTDINQGKQSILESQARIRNMGTEAELRRLQIEAAKEAKMAKGAGSVQDKAYAEAVANSPYSAGSYDTAAGKKALMEHLKSVPEMDQRDISDILYNLDLYYKDGITIGTDKDGKPIKAPLPVNVIMDAVNGSSDNLLAVGWSRRGDDVVNLIDDRFGITSSGYQRPDKMAKADKDVIAGMQMIQGLQAERLKRLQPKAGKDDHTSTVHKLKDGRRYVYGPKGLEEVK